VSAMCRRQMERFFAGRLDCTRGVAAAAVPPSMTSVSLESGAVRMNDQRVSQAVWCDPGPISWVRISGADAVRFVDSFNTAAVSRVVDGAGTEGFFTDVRGQVICMAGLLRCGPDAGEEPAVEIVADGDVGSLLAEHLERYHIREPIEIADVSADRCTRIVLGAAIEAQLAALTAAPSPRQLTTPFDHAELLLAAAVAGGGAEDGNTATMSVRLVRCDWAGPDAWLLVGRAEDAARLEAVLTACGVSAADPSVWNAARIEAGTPRQCDLLPKTLPQELGRDARAISFTKGCYLGQETVARLDALGHVNRRLMGFAVHSERVPLVGAAITADGETIGNVSSSCYSPKLGKPLVVAMLPVKFAGAASIRVAGDDARLVDWPVR
jgi:folate-binding protein YgfZ